MKGLFGQMLEVSLALSTVIALLLALRPLLSRRVQARALYWVWLLAALRLCIPLNVSLPQAPVQVEVEERTVYLTFASRTNLEGPLNGTVPEAGGGNVSISETEGHSLQVSYIPTLSLETVLTALWLAGGGSFLVWNLAQYVRFRLRVRRWCGAVEEGELLARFAALKMELGVGELRMALCPAVRSPMVTGFVSPVLLLPDEAVSDAVLRHELIHARRHDLWYKLLLLLARSLHWFNPLVHLMAMTAGRDLEISCDEAAVAGKDAAFRAAYSRAILDAVEQGQREYAPLTTHFRGGKKAMLERLRAILTAGRKRRGIALVCAAALIVPTIAGACALVEKPEPPGQLRVEEPMFTFLVPNMPWSNLRSGYGRTTVFEPSQPGEPPAGGVIHTALGMEQSMAIFYETERFPADGTIDLSDYRRESPDFTPLLTNYGILMSRDDGTAILPAAATALQVTEQSGPQQTPDGFSPYAWYQTLVTRADGRQEIHWIHVCNLPNGDFYDLWFDLSQVPMEQAQAAHDSFVLGYDRTLSPDGSRMMTILPVGSYCMLYDTSGPQPVPLGYQIHTGGMMGRDGYHPPMGIYDPIWSPDGQQVVVTAAAADRTTFSFPLGPGYPEMTLNSVGGVAGATVAALGNPYSLGVEWNIWQRCVPLRWGEDSRSLEFSYEWLDTDGTLHRGTAWYCQGENSHLAEIRDPVEREAIPMTDGQALTVEMGAFTLDGATYTLSYPVRARGGNLRMTYVAGEKRCPVAPISGQSGAEAPYLTAWAVWHEKLPGLDGYLEVEFPAQEQELGRYLADWILLLPAAPADPT